MRKIGREVGFFAAAGNNSRNGEGDFIRLRDGAILCVYTAYVTADWHDHAVSVLRGLLSRDGGESFQDIGTLVRPDRGAANVMSVSLLRMQNGDIGLFYLQKRRVGDAILDEYLLRRSCDEGRSFGEPSVCIPCDGYRVVNNDRVVRLSSGRLLIPLAYHGRGSSPGVVSVLFSDDDGASFQESGRLYPPYPHDKAGFQEPGVIEMPDGRIRLWIRTELGFQFEAFSEDGGLHFTEPRPNFFFTSPCSPMQMKRVGDYTVAVFNPVPFSRPLANEGVYWHSWWGRTPLVCAVSEDGGETFPRCYYLEDDPKENYCYPALLPLEDGFLLGYYHSNGSPVCLNSMKLVKVGLRELSE